MNHEASKDSHLIIFRILIGYWQSDSSIYSSFFIISLFILFFIFLVYFELKFRSHPLVFMRFTLALFCKWRKVLKSCQLWSTLVFTKMDIINLIPNNQKFNPVSQGYVEVTLGHSFRSTHTHTPGWPECICPIFI